MGSSNVSEVTKANVASLKKYTELCSTAVVRGIQDSAKALAGFLSAWFHSVNPDKVLHGHHALVDRRTSSRWSGTWLQVTGWAARGGQGDY